ncbi:MAG: hypothetical protein KatS3mg055_2289 [Chloroflexus sp.]|nr:MAG: hypothetical protein KatS3mg055_2289 [Chloroflexus sp.]
MLPLNGWMIALEEKRYTTCSGQLCNQARALPMNTLPHTYKHMFIPQWQMFWSLGRNEMNTPPCRPTMACSGRRFAPHPAGPTAQDVGIDHRGLPILVAQKLLHGAHIIASLKHMRRNAMAKRVAGDALLDTAACCAARRTAFCNPLSS